MSFNNIMAYEDELIFASGTDFIIYPNQHALIEKDILDLATQMGFTRCPIYLIKNGTLTQEIHVAIEGADHEFDVEDVAIFSTILLRLETNNSWGTDLPTIEAMCAVIDWERHGCDLAHPTETELIEDICSYPAKLVRSGYPFTWEELEAEMIEQFEKVSGKSVSDTAMETIKAEIVAQKIVQ